MIENVEKDVPVDVVVLFDLRSRTELQVLILLCMGIYTKQLCKIDIIFMIVGVVLDWHGLSNHQ